MVLVPKSYRGTVGDAGIGDGFPLDPELQITAETVVVVAGVGVGVILVIRPGVIVIADMA